MASKTFLVMMDIKSCVYLAYSKSETVEELMRELKAVVYRLKRLGPMTEPWGDAIS